MGCTLLAAVFGKVALVEAVAFVGLAVIAAEVGVAARLEEETASEAGIYKLGPALFQESDETPARENLC